MLTPRLAAAAGLLLLTLCALPARATTPFGYEWNTPRVKITWREGNDTPDMPALRRQVAHWKRLAQTWWTEKPDAPPLEMDVSLYGSALGGEEPPRARLKAGSRTATVEEPITETAVARAMLQVRDGKVPEGPLTLPPDDTEPSISPDGKLAAMVTWRGAGPEVWITRRHAGSHLLRVRFPGPERLMDRLIQDRPQWSPDGRLLSWIQGGRLVLLDSANADARLGSPPGKQVLSLHWAPAPFTPLAVRYEDGSADLIDLLRGKSVSLPDVVPDALPSGELFWSPSGKRLLYRTRTGVASRDLAGALKATATTPSGGEDRIAVFNLADRKLETYPAAALPTGEEIRGVTWSEGEDLAYLVVGHAGYPATLVRFPLRSGASPETVLVSKEPLVPLGLRGEREYAFAQGSKIVLVGESASGPREVTEVLSTTMNAGPFGSYAGMELDQVTENETPLRILMEKPEAVPQNAMRGRFPGVLYAALPRDGALEKAVLSSWDRTAVDADVYVGEKLGWAVVASSPDGGVCRLAAWDTDTKVLSGIQEIPFTERISGMKAAEATPRDEPYPPAELRTGLTDIANQYRRKGGLQVALVTAALLTFLLLGFLVFGRGRARSG